MNDFNENFESPRLNIFAKKSVGRLVEMAEVVESGAGRVLSERKLNGKLAFKTSTHHFQFRFYLLPVHFPPSIKFIDFIVFQNQN